MAIKGKVFKGTPRTAALTQPYIAPSHPGEETGVFWGIDLKTHKVLTLDGYGLRKQGIVNGLVTRVDGVREAGKSAFMKSMSLRMMGLQAGLDDEGYPIPFRCRITDQKPEDGNPEYQALTEALRSKVIKPAKDGKINPFDASMGDVVSLLETSINLAETILGRPLRRFEPLAQQVAVAQMYNEYFLASSPEVLERIFRSLNKTDLDAYYKSNDTALMASFGERLKREPELQDQLQLLTQRPHIVPIQEFEQDAAQMAAAIGQLLRGDYGNAFGDGLSMRGLLSQPVATIDRTGMGPKVRTIFEALMWRWQSWALEHNDLSLIPHLNVGDEESDSYQSLMYLRFYDDYVRKARAFHTWDMKATQFSSRLGKVGAEGSEARELAKSIDLGVAIRVIGKQPKDDDVLDNLTNLGLSDADAYFCTELPTGCFGLKAGNKPVIFFQYILTPLEYEIVKSNTANERMLQRANIYSYEAIRRRSEQVGTLNVGTE